MTRAACEALDRTDPLAFARGRFSLPEDVIYLDGNSLGALPLATASRLNQAIHHEWGHGLIRSWNSADWISLPKRVGDRLAELLGAGSGEVIAADSTSVNLFKVLAGALKLAAGRDESRHIILSESGNFPTDLYVAQGINAALDSTFEIQLVDGDIGAAFNDRVAVALITQVDYRSGRLHDMRKLVDLANQSGVRIVWDLSHSAGAVPIELNKSGAELAVGCGYKYLNGGPGAPGYLYVARALHEGFPMPLAGWFGHRAPFDFSAEYVPCPSIERFQCGTPSVLAMLALECGLDTFQGVSMHALRRKSLALSDLFWALMESHCGEFGFACVSPREPLHRGSQLSFAHEDAYAIMQAIIDRGVIGDFRQPDLLRFGFTPLYLRHVDIWDAVMVLREVMLGGTWKSAKYQQRNKVT